MRQKNDLRSTIHDYLLSIITGAKSVSGGKQIVCRCPICMDSADLSSAHFYIGPFSGQEELIQYDCKKCNSHGMFSFQTLRLFGIYEYELGVLLNQYNSAISGSSSYQSIHMIGRVHNVTNTYITDGEVSRVKLKYINDRLGLNLTMEEIIQNKIILNLFDFLNENRIRQCTRHQNIMEQLNKYFIGFLSYDNGFINMRRLCSEGKVFESIDKRYVNYNVYNNIDNSLRFYIPPIQLDLMSPEPVHVWITEGPFDTLGVKYHVVDNSNKNLVLSVAGKSYLAGIKFLIQNLGIINMIIHLCPDSDVSDWSMISIINYLKPFGIEILVHRNMSPNQKDFGVRKDQICNSIINL